MTSRIETSNTPPTARASTLVEKILRLLGRGPLPRDPGALLRAASRATGLTEFGPPQFMEAFHILHHSLRNEALLHPTGERLACALLHDLLCNRLRIEQTKRTLPAVASEKIERPIIIIGLPRTGSTFLQRLIAADPAFRTILYKEGLHPAPPPGLTPHLDTTRHAHTEKFCHQRRTLVPRLDLMHEMTPDSPEECSTLLRNTFLHGSFHLIGPMPTYSHHFWTTDRAPSYDDYHHQLKLLQHARPPRRWLLKAPSHWSQIHHLPRLFPDTIIIHLHRHPRDVIASWVPMFTALMELHSTYRPDPVERANAVAANFHNHLRTLHEFREQNPTVPVCDITYNDLTRDPMAQIHKIYTFADQPLTAASETALRAHLEHDRSARKNHTREKSPRPGPTDAELNEIFAPYLARHPGL